MSALRIEARLKSGGEWFLTDKIYKTDKARRIALADKTTGILSKKFEYREAKI